MTMTFAPVAPTIYLPPTKIAPDTYVINQVQEALGQPLIAETQSLRLPDERQEMERPEMRTLIERHLMAEGAGDTLMRRLRLNSFGRQRAALVRCVRPVRSEGRRRSFPVVRRALFTLFGVVLGLGLVSAAAGADPSGNSAAAQACQQGGYMSLVGTDGGFANEGACTSYAARGGTFVTRVAGEFLLVAGQTATLSNTSFSGCNALSYGYRLSDGSFTLLGSKPAGCDTTGPQSGATIGPFPTTVTFSIVLIDNKCNATFDSTGNHARVTGTNPAIVDIMDAGGGCSAVSSPRSPGNLAPGAGDLSTTVTIA